MKLFEELKWRGLINDVTNEEEIRKLLNEGRATFYIGTDPTGDSLHLGHFSSFLIVKRLKDAGHNPIMLVGGATGLIGDPRPSSERTIISKEAVNHNYESLKNQLEKLFDCEVVNNYDWCKNINFIDFLRDYGKYFNINYMLDKETIKTRMDTGITYTEFSYMIMQALDFLHLYENKNCVLQVAGSDQWGNITAGVELIRKKTGNEAYAFTMPLIVDSAGKKFGKSEGNAIWLDKEKTSSYELYQFLINSEDSMVISYLKYLTFLSKEEIDNLEVSLKNEPHLRIPHKALAKEVITLLHGEEEYVSAIKISECMFKGNIKDLTEKELESACRGLTTIEIKPDNIINILVDNNIVASKREAREFLSNNAITINGDKITDLDYTINEKDYLYDKYIVIRKGKKNYYVGKRGE